MCVCVGGGGGGGGGGSKPLTSLQASIDFICLILLHTDIVYSRGTSSPGSRWAGKERAWYTLFAHAFNLPKIWGLRGIF